MIISTPEELRLYLPNHVMQNLDGMLGYLDNSEHDFLAERIGEPLLDALNKQYEQMTIPDDIIGSVQFAYGQVPDPWVTLLVLCQRCVVYDAFYRAADIQLVSVNNGSINLPSSDNYDSATTEAVKNYKAQMQKEAHAATNRLLIQLERWQNGTLPLTEGLSLTDEQLASIQESINAILTLWRSSAYYYYADGLLFNTATEFNLFVNIYDSREKFIQILPDIRYCQETHIEAEIGSDLLDDLIAKHKAGTLNSVEKKAYQLLQRALSLMVESRSKLFSRKEAKDESIGQLHLAISYIQQHQSSFDQTIIASSPVFVAPSTSSAQSSLTSSLSCDQSQGFISSPCRDWSQHSGMLVSSII